MEVTKPYNIIYEEADEFQEIEGLWKGRRNDVVVTIGEKKCKLYLIDMVRLKQDYYQDVEYHGYYSTDPNTIIVNEVSFVEIEKTIKNLFEEKYFDVFGYTIKKEVSEPYNIIYENDQEITENEAVNKGFRNDVIVAIGEKNYKLYITNIKKLEQDFYAEVEDGGVYSSKPNMIIVTKVTKAEIEKTIKILFERKFFKVVGYMN